MFQLSSSYKPTGDQPEAIARLTNNIRNNIKEQVLLGVTGSGKTFTISNVIENLQLPTLVISHNKTLAAQLYQEFRDFFPHNAVSYFVSYYDYYQPEAYVPSTDTYIEKETEINEDLDKLRLAATTNILTRRDTIVVASVSCIYNIGSPKEYGSFILELKAGMKVKREQVLMRLVELQYERNNFSFRRSTFRVRGETIDIFPAYEDIAYRLKLSGSSLQSIEAIDPLTGTNTDRKQAVVIYPAKHFMTNPETYKEVFPYIKADLAEAVARFQKSGKLIEAQRLEQRVNYDLEMIQELGYVNGIENYSRYFDDRKPGDPPYTLFDYFDHIGPWLLVLDESHMTIPQVRGMYNGDRSRKQTLIDFGFRLPAALDNRPLRFEEFLRTMPQTIYVSATPDEWEKSRVQEGAIVEQLVRPTGLLDPEIQIRPVSGQIQDLMNEITIRVARKQRVLVTTMTKQMAEDLTKYLTEHGLSVQYLHSDIETLKRADVLDDLRQGIADVIVGINLLREGLDLPEVSLVVILDADKQGFLRSKTSLIQTMGRAARHQQGQVILYADQMTDAIVQAIDEVSRRRQVQIAYNTKHHIVPRSIEKPIRSKLVEKTEHDAPDEIGVVDSETLENLTPKDKNELVKRLTRLMNEAARDLDFERASKLRDTIAVIRIH